MKRPRSAATLSAADLPSATLTPEKESRTAARTTPNALPGDARTPSRARTFSAASSSRSTHASNNEGPPPLTFQPASSPSRSVNACRAARVGSTQSADNMRSVAGLRNAGSSARVRVGSDRAGLPPSALHGWFVLVKWVLAVRESMGLTSSGAEGPQLSALSPPEFTSYLASAVGQRVAAPECAAGIVRRASARRLAVKDLWLILMKSGHDQSWVPARRVALDMVEGHRGLAVSIAKVQEQYARGARLDVEILPTVGLGDGEDRSASGAWRRTSRRIGGNRARCAVARSILVIIWHLLANPEARFTRPLTRPAATTATGPKIMCAHGWGFSRSGSDGPGPVRSPWRSPACRPSRRDNQPEQTRRQEKMQLQMRGAAFWLGVE